MSSREYELAKKVEERLRELEAKQNELLKRLRKLRKAREYRGYWLDYHWAKQPQYKYYYLRWRGPDGKVHSKYLGARPPKEYIKLLEEAKEYKRVYKQLQEINAKIQQIKDYLEYLEWLLEE